MQSFVSPGAIVTRTQVHDVFGGQRQRGISTSKTSSVILLFSMKHAEKSGYKNGWDADGSHYWYCGEGQVGSMKMEKGNLAIANHMAAEKDLLLFENQEKYSYLFVGVFSCVDVSERVLRDRTGSKRSAIVFKLRCHRGNEISMHSEIDELEQETDSLQTLRLRALSSAPTHQSFFGKRNYYSRSRDVRAYALGCASGICQGCNLPAPFRSEKGVPYLEVHHIGRRADGFPDHPKNVVALCANCHRKAHLSDDKASFNEKLRLNCQRREQQANESASPFAITRI